jgi:hypothetical protein
MGGTPRKVFLPPTEGRWVTPSFFFQAAKTAYRECAMEKIG